MEVLQQRVSICIARGSNASLGNNESKWLLLFAWRQFARNLSQRRQKIAAYAGCRFRYDGGACPGGVCNCGGLERQSSILAATSITAESDLAKRIQFFAQHFRNPRRGKKHARRGKKGANLMNLRLYICSVRNLNSWFIFFREWDVLVLKFLA
jgi:hypothetical protein